MFDLASESGRGGREAGTKDVLAVKDDSPSNVARLTQWR